MIILTTYLSHGLHLENFLNSIAYPIGHLNEYRYEKKYVDENIRNSVRKGQRILYSVVLNSETSQPTTFPVREGTLVRVEKIGEFYFFVVRLERLVTQATLDRTINHGTLVYESHSKEITYTTYNDAEWFSHLDTIYKTIESKLNFKCCFLHLDFKNAVNDCIDDFSTEVNIPSSTANRCSIYEPHAQDDCYIDILYYYPGYSKDALQANPTEEKKLGAVVSNEIEVLLPSDAGSHTIDRLVISSKCNRTRIPINFSLIKNHPLGSITLKNNSELKVANPILYYKINFTRLYAFILAMTIVISILKGLSKIHFTGDFVLPVLLSVATVNLAYKFKEKIGF